MAREPMTLRKLLAKLPPDELEKFMDVPLSMQVRDEAGNVEFIAVADWPNRAEPRPGESYPGHFRLVGYAQCFFRHRKAI
jgi:hypothetical protein